jgi:hypothetical protein
MLVILEGNRFVFKHLISGTPHEERGSVKRKRGYVRQLIYRKYAKGRIMLLNRICKLGKKFV